MKDREIRYMSKEYSNLKRVFGNSAWVIASKIINIIVGIVVSACVTRYLGAEQKGVMADAQAISGFWGFIAGFGLLDISITSFSKEKDKSGEFAATGMTLLLCGGVVAFLMSFFSSIVLGVNKEVLIYVVICSCVYIFQCLTMFEYWFYSNSISKSSAIAHSVIHILFMIIRVCGVPLRANLSYFVIAAVTESIVGYLSLVFCYEKTRCFFIGNFSFNKQLARDIFRQALPMIAMGFATTIYMKVDQIMVGKMLGNRELGYYSVAVHLAESWYFVPATIYSSFLPIIAESYKKCKNEFFEKLQQFADLMTSVGYVAIAGVMLFGRWGIMFLYGMEFEKSSYILMVYIWSGLFTCLSYSAQAFYIINKDTKTIMWLNLTGAGLNFLLNLILITLLGSVGAAIATFLEYLFVAFGAMIVLRNKYWELYAIQLKSFFPFFRLWTYGKKYLEKREAWICGICSSNNTNAK